MGVVADQGGRVRVDHRVVRFALANQEENRACLKYMSEGIRSERMYTYLEEGKASLEVPCPGVAGKEAHQEVTCLVEACREEREGEVGGPGKSVVEGGWGEPFRPSEGLRSS